MYDFKVDGRVLTARVSTLHESGEGPDLFRVKLTHELVARIQYLAGVCKETDVACIVDWSPEVEWGVQDWDMDEICFLEPYGIRTDLERLVVNSKIFYFSGYIGNASIEFESWGIGLEELTKLPEVET